MPTKLQKRVFTGAVGIAAALALTPALAPGAPPANRGDEKRADAVEWLPDPNDPDPLHGRSVESSVRNERREIVAAERRREARQAAYPVDGTHDYGNAGSGFGVARPGHMHAGQDVFASAGTPLVAVRDAVVLETGTDGGRGNYVAIYSPATRETYAYLHMEAPARVAAGDRVSAGERLGAVGCTGSCSGDHLHFEQRQGRSLQGEPVDPLPLLSQLDRS